MLEFSGFLPFARTWGRSGGLSPKVSTKNPGLGLLQRKVDELGLRREVEDKLSQILIEHKITEVQCRTASVFPVDETDYEHAD
jgi:hypothetical protein